MSFHSLYSICIFVLLELAKVHGRRRYVIVRGVFFGVRYNNIHLPLSLRNTVPSSLGIYLFLLSTRSAQVFCQSTLVEGQQETRDPSLRAKSGVDWTITRFGLDTGHKALLKCLHLLMRALMDGSLWMPACVRWVIMEGKELVVVQCVGYRCYCDGDED